MKQIAIIATLVALLLLAGTAFAQGAPAIPWTIFSGGGGHAEANGISLDSTIGQPMVGLSVGFPDALCAGYWCGTAVQYRIYLPLVLRYK